MRQSVLPDSRGYFGSCGGRFVPEVLIPALEELTAAGNDHEMAAGVRVTVHHDKCALPLQEA